MNWLLSKLGWIDPEACASCKKQSKARGFRHCRPCMHSWRRPY